MRGITGGGLAVGALLVMGAAALAGAATSRIKDSRASLPVLPRPSPSLPVRPYAADSLARVTLARPLFRFGRRASSVAYDPARTGQPVVTELRTPKPVLLLVGMVAGADPSAVIEGFPGIEGARVVRAGDVIAGLRVQRIVDSTVRIAGMDTVWTLTVRKPWR